MSKPFLKELETPDEERAIAAEYPRAKTEFCDDNPDGRGYICTRQFGHTGPHVAHAAERQAVAIWQYEWELTIN